MPISSRCSRSTRRTGSGRTATRPRRTAPPAIAAPTSRSLAKASSRTIRAWVPILPDLQPLWRRNSRTGRQASEGTAVGPTGLASRLQERTASLHRRAERSGFIRMMLQGRASREGYALFLLNLLPAYRALDAALELGRADPCLARLARPALYRAAAIERDLLVLVGARERWPAMLPAGAAYGERVARS